MQALLNVDLTIGEGEVVGLLGLNGAGKTTMLKVISTLLLPTAGTVRIDGVDVVADTRRARELFSVVFGGERGFYNRLSARDNLRFFGVLAGVSRRLLTSRTDEALEQVGLGDSAGRPVETFSTGMKQRLHLATGLLTTPRLLMLDEPTVGLDPIEAERLRRSISLLRGEPVAILLTSHYLNEIERLASRVAILEEGRLTHDLLLEHLLARAGVAAEITLSGSGPVPTNAGSQEMEDRAGIRPLGVRLAEGSARGWTLTFEVKRWEPESLRALAALWPDSEVTDVHVQPANLERVFAELARPTDKK